VRPFHDGAQEHVGALFAVQFGTQGYMDCTPIPAL
jgi:hypothetical protein